MYQFETFRMNDSWVWETRRLQSGCYWEGSAGDFQEVIKSAAAAAPPPSGGRAPCERNWVHCERGLRSVTEMDTPQRPTLVISGMSGRFPECDSIEELKEKLYSGENMVTSKGCRWGTDISEELKTDVHSSEDKAGITSPNGISAFYNL
ncbi:uncharacterized protein LOC124606092 [Schistocerca americana]|uniref:uncharacterized protein LOC124606092 n=1 Tax=Schistocerca americana TaxID=7009 RepID=UPI001F4F8E42|nr:uncharacterized protein LOC124606092 [Schistocerca americana]